MKKLLLTTALSVVFTASIANAAGVGGSASGGATVNSGVAGVGVNTSVDANTRSTGATSVDANTRSTGASSVDANTRTTGGASVDSTTGVTGGVIDAPVNIDSDVESETRINGSNSGYVRTTPIVQKTRIDTPSVRGSERSRPKTTVGKDGVVIVPATSINGAK